MSRWDLENIKEHPKRLDQRTSVSLVHMIDGEMAKFSRYPKQNSWCVLKTTTYTGKKSVEMGVAKFGNDDYTSCVQVYCGCGDDSTDIKSEKKIPAVSEMFIFFFFG